MTDTKHSSVMGGSTAAQRIYCPGSYQLEQKVPKNDKDSDYAAEGTALHEATEYMLLELSMDANPVELIGMVFNEITITEEMVDNKIRPALGALKEIMAKYGEGEPLDYLVEFTGSLDSVIPGAFGTIDLLGRFKSGKVLALDWKFGDGVPVSVEGNMQLGFYAGCAMYTKDDEDINDLLPDGHIDFIFAIVQPRRGHDGPCYEVWETDSDWVEDFLDLAEKAYHETQKPDAPVKTGSHCRWCRAQPICPAKQKQIGVAVSTPLTAIDPVTLGKYLAVADQVESWAKSVRKMAHKALEDGSVVPGYKLVPKRAQRVYNDEEKARGVLVRQLKTEAAHQPRKLITPAQAEKALGKAKYTKLLEKYVSKVSSGNTMAPDKDSRPDVSDTLTQLGSVGKIEGDLFKEKV